MNAELKSSGSGCVLSTACAFNRARMAVRAGITLAMLGCISNLLAQAPEVERNESLRQAMGVIIAESHVPDSALQVHRQALSMMANDRYKYLADWVLPGKSHGAFRVSSDFTSTYPAPPVSDHDAIDQLRIELAKRLGQRRVQTGGNLISPALDLVAVASELGKLVELRKRVDASSAVGNSERRAKLSILAIIDIKTGDISAALRHLDALYPLIEANDGQTLPARSAELLAIHVANTHPQTRPFAREAATHIFQRTVRVPGRGAIMAWESHVLGMIATSGYLDRVGPDADIARAAAEMSLAPPLTEWLPSSRTTAAFRGSGTSKSHWQRAGDRIEKSISHGDDLLYYHIPLQGTFEVECDLQTKDYQTTQLIVGGHWAQSMYYDRDKYEYGDLLQQIGRSDIQPKLTHYRDSMHMRVKVKDQTVTYFANGRLLHQVEVRGDVDPWIVLRSDSKQNALTTDIRITSNSSIPDEIRLTASENLTGWFPYFEHDIGTPKATWQQLGDLASGGGIVASHRSDLAGTHVEQLLHYHRPMFEDGAIEYEFFYRTGATHMHPALDRSAFVLEPNGVRIHWVTDGKDDRTGLSPDNMFDEPGQRRGPEMLPLVENAWNRLRLTLEGDSVSLYLNQQLIYQREIEITNQRSFGLFYYSDRTEARVRNVRWRGAWPRVLPPVAKQELASPTTQRLDERLPELTAVAEHDFAKDGLPPEKFTLLRGVQGSAEHVPQGVRVAQPGGSGYFATSIAVNILIPDDFDIVAEYQQFNAQPSGDLTSTVGIKLGMSEVNPQEWFIQRRFVRQPKQEDRHVIQAVVQKRTPAGDYDWVSVYDDANESNSGRLRIARRGNRLFYLAAETDSPNFRLLGESEAVTGTPAFHKIELLAMSSGQGATSVLWKNIAIRAKSLTYSSPGNVAMQQTLSVMNHDGTGLRRLLPKDSEITAPGSPAFSPNGKLVAFDDYHGSTAKSRMFIIDPNGSNIRDLGIGNMPTFSPDSKRIAFSWGGKGIAVMDIDGTNRQVLDANGWGAQWSPDGRIAYAKGNNIVVLDPLSKMQHEVLEGEQSLRYTSIFWNLGWSRDGKLLCFKATTRDKKQYEIAVTAAAGSRHAFQVLYSSPQEMVADFSWHPDGNRILFCTTVGGGPRLFTLDRSNPGQAKVFAGQPPNHYITGADWSNDGQQIVFSSQVLPDWKPASAR